MHTKLYSGPPFSSCQVAERIHHLLSFRTQLSITAFKNASALAGIRCFTALEWCRESPY
jgi:hypothetical protein